MATPFLGEIKIVAFNYAPRGWAECNGQLLPINQNQALFSLLGTTYGGDGRVNFALPDLRGRVSLHQGQGYVEGQRGGEENHTLAVSEMPAHIHVPNASTQSPDQSHATGNLWASNTSFSPYGATVNQQTILDPSTIASAGGSQPHNNMSPYLALLFCIALQGIFPSRN